MAMEAGEGSASADKDGASSSPTCPVVKVEEAQAGKMTDCIICAEDTEASELAVKQVPQFDWPGKWRTLSTDWRQSQGGISVTFGMLLLFTVPIMWGTYGASLRWIYAQPGPPRPSVLTLARKLIAVAFFFVISGWSWDRRPSELVAVDLEEGPEEGSEKEGLLREDNGDAKSEGLESLAQKKAQASTGMIWTGASEIGLWTFLGTALQAWGLEYTTATRAGFVVQTTNILVPLLAALSGEEVRPAVWVAATLALGGVTLMGLDRSHTSAESPSSAYAGPCGPMGTGPDCESIMSPMLLGDAAVLAAAFFYALQTVRLGAYAGKLPAVKLTSALMVVAATLSAMWTAADLASMAAHGEDLHGIWVGWQSTTMVVAVLISALLPGALASLAQTVGQSVVPAAEAQVLYSLQPVWSALFGIFLLGEEMGERAWIGGAIVLLATVVASRYGSNSGGK